MIITIGIRGLETFAFGDGGVETEELGDGYADGGEGEGSAEPGEEGAFCIYPKGWSFRQILLKKVEWRDLGDSSHKEKTEMYREQDDPWPHCLCCLIRRCHICQSDPSTTIPPPFHAYPLHDLHDWRPQQHPMVPSAFVCWMYCSFATFPHHCLEHFSWCHNFCFSHCPSLCPLWV